MKYFIYCRKSSEDKKKQIQSIPDQLAWASEVAKTRELEIIETFTDSKTGTKPGREGFNAMIEAILNQGEPVGIVCWKMDRLARNPIDEGAIKYAFIQGKIKHILAKDREFREGENQILMGVEFGAATQYSIELSRNVKRGMKSKVEKGWKPGLAPLGYLNDPVGLKGEKKIYPDPERFEQVKNMWKMLLSGAHTVPQILNIANEKWSFRDKRGTKLSRSTLYDIFNNQFYTGMFRWDGLHQGNHEPMVTLEEFDQAQAILGAKGKPRLQTHEHNYTGIIRCAECGYMITAEPPKIRRNKTNGKVRTYHYMRCSKRNPNHKCSQKCIQVKDLEDQVNDLLDSIEISPAYEEWVFRQLRDDNKKETAKLIGERSQLQKQFNDNEAMIENLTDKLLKKVVSDVDYKIHLKRFEERREHLRKEMQNYDERKDNWLDEVEKAFELARDARKLFVKGGRDEKRKALIEIGSNLLLKNQVVLVEAKIPYISIRDAVEKERPILRRFEPANQGLDKLKKASLEKLIPIWSG
jgi:site-specific DNA recombinase